MPTLKYITPFVAIPLCIALVTSGCRNNNAHIGSLTQVDGHAADHQPTGSPPAEGPGDWQTMKLAADRALMNNDYATARSHLAAALKKIEGTSNDNAEASLWDSMGRVNLAERKYPEAEQAFSQSLKFSKIAYGESGRPVAYAYEGLKKAYKGQKKYDESEKAARLALETAQKHHTKPDDPALEGYISGVLEVACLNGTCKDESPLTERLYRIRLSTLGPDHPHTVAARQMLAEAFEHHKNYKQAEILYKDNFRIAEKRKSNLNPARINLARVITAQGRFAEAHRLAQLVSSDKQDKQFLAEALQVDAEIYDKEGQHQKAAELFAKVIDLLSDRLGKDSRSLANYYFEYADMLKAAGRTKEAAVAEQEGSRIANAPESGLPGTSTRRLD